MYVRACHRRIGKKQNLSYRTVVVRKYRHRSRKIPLATNRKQHFGFHDFVL